MARPCKLVDQPHLTEEIAKHIELGMSYRLAAQLARVSEDSVYDWMKTGKKLFGESSEEELKDDPVALSRIRFYQRVKEAEALAARNALVKIQVASGNGAWQASAWLLERRYPEEYGRDRMGQQTGEQMNSTAIVIPGIQLPPPGVTTDEQV